MSWALYPQMLALTGLLLALIAAGHVVLNKREVRSAAAWVGVLLLLPWIGTVLYVLLGVNRIRRTAGKVRTRMQRYTSDSPLQLDSAALAERLAPEAAHLVAIARTVERTSRWGLLPGNHIVVLRDGDEAYPEMLRSIEAAQRSIVLCTYIFGNDEVGQRFVEALGAARARGVQVRVLVDDVGARYSFPSIDYRLRAHDVRVARFMPMLTTWSVGFANLRNHRKVLVVDGTVGFTGGMNLRAACVRAVTRDPTLDLHFRCEGPVVQQLSAVFAEDWTFTTAEVLGELWFRPPVRRGVTYARAISDGPDRDLDCIPWALHGAIGSARSAVRILTPYFLPDEPLITALNAAALRGVRVQIVLPARGNLRLVDWAMRGELWKVLKHGCEVFLTDPPFDHAKLMTVDGAWGLVGSANWDPRSLRLNFELAVECYDPELARRLDAVIDGRLAHARALTEAALASQAWPVRLRNAAVRLLSPYL